ncbi:hypothetical protein [Rheinheimera tilapiae]|uniref:Uncharacterized protein n=1 Tax=Rheinheimera tilapiae TaxID=875043 RepID=A0ABV6B7U8_9GAMM
MMQASGRLNDIDLALYRSMAPGYESIAMYPEQLQRFREVTVQMAQELLREIDNKYPKLKPPVPSESPTE